ncbi:hypothetical protein ACFQZC_02780 [Streptacidiphilus monticola]
MTTLRLARIRRRGDVIAVACVLGIATALALSTTRAAEGECWLAGAVVVAVLSVGVPRTFWLRADEHGVTLVRLFVPRRYAWSDVRGIAVDFGEDPDTDARHARLRLHLADPPGHRWGPLLAGLPVTDDKLPRGGEPRELAELLALFGRRGLPVGPPAFADAVLAAQGLPAPGPAPPPRADRGRPPPERAYADAPEPEEEKRRLELSRRLSPISTSPRHRREYLLRRAAAADRIALRNGDSGLEDVAAALLWAGRLADHDGVTADDDPRGYVRQQYLAWRSARR